MGYEKAPTFWARASMLLMVASPPFGGVTSPVFTGGYSSTCATNVPVTIRIMLGSASDFARSMKRWCPCLSTRRKEHTLHPTHGGPDKGPVFTTVSKNSGPSYNKPPLPSPIRSSMASSASSMADPRRLFVASASSPMATLATSFTMATGDSATLTTAENIPVKNPMLVLVYLVDDST